MRRDLNYPSNLQYLMPIQNCIEIEPSGWNPRNRSLEWKYTELYYELEDLSKVLSNAELDSCTRLYYCFQEKFIKFHRNILHYRKISENWNLEHLTRQANSGQLSPNPEDFMDIGSPEQDLQKAYARMIALKGEIMVFDVQKFVREHVQKVAQLIEGILFYKDLMSEFYQINFKVMRRKGKTFIKQVIRDGRFSDLKIENFFNIEAIVNNFFSFSLLSASGIFFGDILKEDEEKLNIYKLTRDELLWIYFQSPNQIITLALKEDFKAYYQLNLKEARRLQAEESVKPNKNVYPLLFTWIFEAIFQNEDGKNEELEASRLETLIKNMKKRIESNKSEDIEIIVPLKPEDFYEVIEDENRLFSRMSVIREIWEQLGIQESTASEYFKNYLTSDPSFKKMYKVKDNKEIYFWIILMAIILRELPLKATKFKESSLFCWIWQNPNAGSKLKMSIWSLEMRKYYYKIIKDAQNTLMRKFDEKEKMKDLTRRTLEIIGENSHKSEIEGDCKSKGKTKRCPTQTLQEQRLRPIQKILVSDCYMMTENSMPQTSVLSHRNQQWNQDEIFLKEFLSKENLRARLKFASYQQQCRIMIKIMIMLSESCDEPNSLL